MEQYGFALAINAGIANRTTWGKGWSLSLGATKVFDLPNQQVLPLAKEF